MAAERSSKQGHIRDPAYVKTLVIAAFLGIPAAVGAVLFTTAAHEVETVLWKDIPEQFGWIEPASWYVILLPLIAGGIVALCMRLPGRAGHPASEGIGLHPATPVELPSILLAALASLSFGLVLGPEAPLMALGLCFGGVAAHFARAEKEHAKDLVLAGGFAAIAVVLGGPIVAAFMIFEMVASSGAVPAHQIGHVLLPGFVASGTGYLVFSGLGRWHGLDVPELAVPGLPVYETVRVADVAWTVPLAVGVAAVVVLSRRLTQELIARLRHGATITLLVGGAAVGLTAVLYRALADRPVDLVLFSGQASLPAVIAEGSAGVLAALLVAKLIAYGLSLAAGFRGGLIFPSVTLGVIAGALASVALPGFDLTPAVIAGVAAGAASAMTLPFFGALLAALLGGTAGAKAVPVAIIAAAIAWLVTLALEYPVEEEPAATSSATAGSEVPS